MTSRKGKRVITKVSWIQYLIFSFAQNNINIFVICKFGSKLWYPIIYLEQFILNLTKIVNLNFRFNFTSYNTLSFGKNLIACN